MGHYDDAYDLMDDENEARKTRAREAAMPELIESLRTARNNLSRNSFCIKHACRFADDIEVMISAIERQ